MKIYFRRRVMGGAAFSPLCPSSPNESHRFFPVNAFICRKSRRDLNWHQSHILHPYSLKGVAFVLPRSEFKLRPPSLSANCTICMKCRAMFKGTFSLPTHTSMDKSWKHVEHQPKPGKKPPTTRTMTGNITVLWRSHILGKDSRFRLF